jgi:hypothetical protein
MISLLDFQRDLGRVVLSRAAPPDAGREVYRHAYGARLRGALRQNYPVLARRLNAERFDRLASRYVRGYPSSHFNIRWYGAHLCQLLDGSAADIARLEWAIGLAFDARDATPLDWESVKALPVHEWADLPMALHPSVQVLWLSWTAEAAWNEGGRPRRRPHAVFVWRESLKSFWRSVSDEEARALEALGDLGTLQAACERMSDVDMKAMGRWIATWLSQGLLVRGGAR